ncbi:MAG: hypothetical protein WCK59_02905 [Candidatus Falkowbacteria bacterium]
MKALFILIISLMSFFSLNSLADDNKAFLESFVKTVKLNEHRFQDINLVYPGDTVMVVGKGITPIAILPRDSLPGYHDCVWYAVKRSLRQSNGVPKLKPLINKIDEKINFNLSDFIKDNPALIITSLLAGIFLLLLLLIILMAVRRPIIINNNLSCHHPPTVPPTTV